MSCFLLSDQIFCPTKSDLTTKKQKNKNYCKIIINIGIMLKAEQNEKEDKKEIV